MVLSGIKKHLPQIAAFTLFFILAVWWYSIIRPEPETRPAPCLAPDWWDGHNCQPAENQFHARDRAELQKGVAYWEGDGGPTEISLAFIDDQIRLDKLYELYPECETWEQQNDGDYDCVRLRDQGEIIEVECMENCGEQRRVLLEAAE